MLLEGKDLLVQGGVIFERKSRIPETCLDGLAAAFKVAFDEVAPAVFRDDLMVLGHLVLQNIGERRFLHGFEGCEESIQ